MCQCANWRMKNERIKKFTNWKHQQIIIQLTHSVLFYSAANWHIGALVYWHIIKLAH